MTQTDVINEGKYTQANGAKIYYEEYGAGEPLILVHGGTLTGKVNWEAYIATFSQHFRVIIPDSRGHGRTDNPKGELNYRLMADDMAAFCQASALEKPLICGYSDGGQIALELGMRYAQLAKGLIVAAASYRFSEAYFEVFKGLGFEKPGEVNLEQTQQVYPELLAMWQQLHTEVYGPDYWKTLLKQISKMWLTPLEYTEEKLKKITAPTLILFGDRDLLFSVEQAVEMYRMIPNTELAIAPNSNHFFALENPELFANICLDFLLRHTSDVEQN